MRRKIWVVVVVAGLGACASSSRIERGADRHEARARQLEAEGNFSAASKEHEAAAKQHSKANSRRAFEGDMPVVFH